MAINTDFPVPQADRLGKVAIVIDALGAGLDTVPTIAEALGVVDRQGGYYVSAAGYLGLLDRLDTVPVSYALTEAGRRTLDAGPQARADLILAAVGAVPEVDIYLQHSLEGVQCEYERAGLDPDTARRRASTIAAWAQTVTGPGLSAQLTAADIQAVCRAADAIRERVTRRRAATPAPAPTCPRCYLQMASDGSDCENC